MGYVDIDEKLLKKIEEVTLTNYEIVYKRFLKTENVESIFQDLLHEINVLSAKIDDIIRDRDDNYRQLTNKELYDYDEIQWWKVWGKSLIF